MDKLGDGVDDCQGELGMGLSGCFEDPLFLVYPGIVRFLTRFNEVEGPDSGASEIRQLLGKGFELGKVGGAAEESKEAPVIVAEADKRGAERTGNSVGLERVSGIGEGSFVREGIHELGQGVAQGGLRPCGVDNLVKGGGGGIGRGSEAVVELHRLETIDEKLEGGEVAFLRGILGAGRDAAPTTIPQPKYWPLRANIACGKLD